jgi:hypothetical protein
MACVIGNQTSEQALFDVASVCGCLRRMEADNLEMRYACFSSRQMTQD